MKEKRFSASVARFGIVFAMAMIFVGGCEMTSPSNFDRSWNAAIAAAQDVGVRIQSEDRARGIIIGANDSRDVTINVTNQADGAVRVEISARGPQGGDANLANDISRAYDRHMGR